LQIFAKYAPDRKKVKVSGQGLGALIPDAILLSGSTIKGVVDAKYKSLHPSASSPNGPQRDDLYQMAAYLGRFQSPTGMSTWGLLAYPFDPSRPEASVVEQNSPWSLDEGRRIIFATLPHIPADAVAKLRSLVIPTVTPAAWSARA
tara:strand:+ start:906 stop:1343 length:438 start_codon:yes stop_codon:yes gene_type:complete